MEVTVGIFLLLVAMAFICEFIDSSLGMGYGTILAPVLIIMGFEPLVAVPAILISQAFGGFTASVFHHRFENVDFHPDSRDLKIALIITSCGIAATIVAALISINIPKIILKAYIGVLVTAMGLVVLRNCSFVFSWKKIVGVGVLSAFNKGLTGGGFGPVVTGGQIMSGQHHRGAIGVTTLSEAPICTVAFFTYMIGRVVSEIKTPVMKLSVNDFFRLMFSHKIFPWELILALFLGSILVAPFGAFTTRALKREKLHILLGVLITTLGVWTLIKTIWN